MDVQFVTRELSADLLETNYPLQRMQSILSYGGLPMDCRCIVDGLQQAQRQGAAA